MMISVTGRSHIRSLEKDKSEVFFVMYHSVLLSPISSFHENTIMYTRTIRFGKELKESAIALPYHRVVERHCHVLKSLD